MFKNAFLGLIILLYIVSCNSNYNTKQIVSKNLIINKDSLIFLDFWFGMTKDEFQIVCDSLVKDSVLIQENDSFKYVFRLQIFNEIEYCKGKLITTFENNKLAAIILDIEPETSCYCDQFEDEISSESVMTYEKSDKKDCISNESYNAILELYSNKYGKPQNIKKIEYDPSEFFDHFFNEPLINGTGYYWIENRKMIKFLFNKHDYNLINSRKYYDNPFDEKFKMIKKLGVNIKELRIVYTFKTYQDELDNKQREKTLLLKQQKKIEVEKTKNDI